MAWLDASFLVVREISLFAATGFLLLGASDLAVDLTWIGIRLKNLLAPQPAPALQPERPGRLAVFVPAWDEAVVIGPMLRHALGTFAHDDYAIYVGCYPNDPATIAAVEAIGDPRLRIVVGAEPGPTTKADCLNAIWAAMAADEASTGRPIKAVVLHDAEDVVHSAELKLFDTYVERFDLVQLPVLPLIDPKSRWISGHYIDEFAEAHGKEMVVRQALGAGLPSAGVGCAIARDALAALDDGAGPFDRDSLTEDYEVGLKLKALGRRACFARLPGPSGGAICTREHFPATWRDAVNQKSRWMAGIALSGWDRLGWSGGLAERWMRLRDRQAPLAALLLGAGYAALLTAAPLASAATLLGHEAALVTPGLGLMMSIGGALLAWRLAMRFAFVARAYGLFEGLRAIPRVVTSNAVAMLAARAALRRYAAHRRTGDQSWGKTAHIFPTQVPAE